MDKPVMHLQIFNIFLACAAVRSYRCQGAGNMFLSPGQSLSSQITATFRFTGKGPIEFACVLVHDHLLLETIFTHSMNNTGKFSSQEQLEASGSYLIILLVHRQKYVWFTISSAVMFSLSFSDTAITQKLHHQ